MGKNLSINATPLSSNDPAIPCGLIAQSYFNDTFNITYEVNDEVTNVTVSNEGIAWPTDLGLYANTNIS